MVSRDMGCHSVWEPRWGGCGFWGAEYLRVLVGILWVGRRDGQVCGGIRYIENWRCEYILDRPKNNPQQLMQLMN